MIYYAVMTERKTSCESVLERLDHSRVCVNMTAYYDQNLLEDLEGDIWLEIAHAYYESYARFASQVLGLERSIHETEIPKATLVLTRDNEVLRSLYFDPSQFESLPPWVMDYVNLDSGLYVRRISEKSNGPVDVDGSCHEFNHLTMPGVLGIPIKNFGEIWNRCLREGFAVGLNQRQQDLDAWLEKNWRSATCPPSIQTIEDKGIFAHDQRQPHENVAYQYCVKVTEVVGKEIQQRTLRPVTPLAAICGTTVTAFKNGRTFEDEAKSIGINIPEIEHQIKAQLSLN